MDDSLAFGLHIRSDLPLPELTPSRADPGRPRVTIRVGDVGGAVADATCIAPGVQVSPNDFRLEVRDVARYRVREGVEIVVDPAPNAPMRHVRLFLLGTALGVLCYQRGLQPLHANAIEVDGRGLAFAGPPGSGKSTLAAYLHGRRYRVLSDDLCVLSVETDGTILAWPGLAQIKLCDDALTELGHDRASLDRVIGDREKYHLPMPSAAEGAGKPTPLDRLYVLDRAPEGEHGSIRRLTGREALEELLAHVYRPRLVHGLGARADVYARGLAVLQRARVYRFERPWGFGVFEREVERLERHFHEATP